MVSIGWASIARSIYTREITTRVEKRKAATGERFDEWNVRVFPVVSKLFGCKGGVAGYKDEYYVWHGGDVVHGREQHEAESTMLRRELAA